MQVPPNLGIEYTNEFVNLYIDLAEENNLPLIPLILDAVGGYEGYATRQIHPNAEGHFNSSRNRLENLVSYYIYVK